MGTAWPTPVRPRESRQETSISKREALRQRVVGDWAHGAADRTAAVSREPAMDMRIRRMGEPPSAHPPSQRGRADAPHHSGVCVKVNVVSSATPPPACGTTLTAHGLFCPVILHFVALWG